MDAEQASDQAHRLYLSGRTDFIIVLTAESAVANAEVSLALAEAALAEDQVSLFRALSGGWQT